MKKIFMTISVFILVGALSYSHAHERDSAYLMTKLGDELKLNKNQRTLLAAFIDSGKEVRHSFDKVDGFRSIAKRYLKKDQIDAERVMAEYHQWQHTFDLKLFNTLKAMEALHFSLTTEQRQKLIDDLNE